MKTITTNPPPKDETPKPSSHVQCVRCGHPMSAQSNRCDRCQAPRCLGCGE